MVKIVFFRPPQSNGSLTVMQKKESEKNKEERWLNPWFSLVGIVILVVFAILVLTAIDMDLLTNEILNTVQMISPIYAVCVSIAFKKEEQPFLSGLGILAAIIGIVIPGILVWKVMQDLALYAQFGSDMWVIFSEMIVTIGVGAGLTKK